MPPNVGPLAGREASMRWAQRLISTARSMPVSVFVADSFEVIFGKSYGKQMNVKKDEQTDSEQTDTESLSDRLEASTAVICVDSNGFHNALPSVRATEKFVTQLKKTGFSSINYMRSDGTDEIMRGSQVDSPSSSSSSLPSSYQSSILPESSHEQRVNLTLNNAGAVFWFRFCGWGGFDPRLVSVDKEPPLLDRAYLRLAFRISHHMYAEQNLLRGMCRTVNF